MNDTGAKQARQERWHRVLDPDAPEALGLYYEMLRIRRFEEKCAELYSAGHIRGFLHLYIGEEAVAVGAMQSLEDDDTVMATYREHGHALARGIPARAIIAEMMGKVSGCSRGRGGSMHLFDARRRFFGGNAIVAGHLPMAAGMALADKMMGRERVTACFFGEGAMAEGEFHESLNLAALWEVPVLYICENNGYAMGTALARSESQTDLSAKAAGYGIPAWSVDGMDVEAVRKATGKAVEAVRNGGGAHFLEMRTYRFRAHSMFDAELYRDRDEVEDWKKRGPLVRYEATLKERGFLDDQTRKQIEKGIAEEIQDAVDFGLSSEPEPISDLTRFVHTEAA